MGNKWQLTWGWGVGGRNKGGRKQRKRGREKGGECLFLYQRRTVNSADGKPYHARRWLMLSLKWKGDTEADRGNLRYGVKSLGLGGGSNDLAGVCEEEKKEEKKLGKKSDMRGGGGGGRSMGGWWRRVSPQLADEMLHAEERSLSPATTNKARVLMGAAAIKMRGANESTERKREKWNYSSMVQITAGRLSGPSAITIMTTWCDMIVTALKENHSPRLGKR